MLRDIRHGLRVLLQAKGWTTVIVLSLAIGIGASAVLFSAIDGMVLQKLPVTDPDGLVRFRAIGRNDMATDRSDYGAREDNVGTTFSYLMYQHFREANHSLTDLAAFAPLGRVNVVSDGRAELASAFTSTGNYYRVLGVAPRLGRTLTPADDHPASQAVAVISDRYWRARFSEDPAILGKVVRVNNLPVTIVGVLPSDFTGVQRVIAEAPDLSLPLALDRHLNPLIEERLSRPTTWFVQVMGRLKPGGSAAQVQATLDSMFQREARAGLDAYLATLTESEQHDHRNLARTNVPRLVVDSGTRGIYDVNDTDLRGAAVFGAVVAMVLLLVCANIANLLLARVSAREKELAVRLSVGATRGRLIRLLLTESLLLSTAGGAFGIAFAYWGQALLPLPSLALAPTDWRLIAFTGAIVISTGVLFGIAPALRATSIDVGTPLKESTRSVAASQTFLSRALLVAQVAISLVLLVGAGLFLRTLDNLRSVEIGFDARNLVVFRVNPQLNRYDDERVATVYRAITDAVRQITGVRDVTLTGPALLSGGVSTTGFFVQGRTYAPGNEPQIHRLTVAPNFFEVMGIPLAAGRAFTDRDLRSAPRVGIINQAAARKFFADQNPVGHRFGSTVETAGQLEIVGVVADVKYNSLRDPAPPTLYAAYLQRGFDGLSFVVRTTDDPRPLIGRIRESVNRVDPSLPISSLDTQTDHIERRFAHEKFFAQAYSLFGGIAVFVAAIGLFGLMSYGVSRRTREIGIRMAMGAQREAVLGLVARESLVLVTIGIIIGLVMALAAGRLVASHLFGLEPTDVVTMIGAIAVIVAVSAVAGYLPARRAARVDPMVALRWE